MKTKLIFLVLIVLMILPATQALGLLSANYKIDYVPATTKNLVYWVINQDDRARNFSISGGGFPEGKIITPSGNMTIPANSLKRFEVTINFPEQVQADEYTTFITITSCETEFLCPTVSIPLQINTLNNSENTEPKSIKKKGGFSFFAEFINNWKLSKIKESTNPIVKISTNSDNTLALIQEMDNDNRIKAIIIELKSTKTDINELLPALKATNKPVVALMWGASSVEALIHLDLAVDKIVAPANMPVNSNTYFDIKQYWSSSEAKEMGLIDYVGDKQKANDIAEELAGVSDSKLISLW